MKVNKKNRVPFGAKRTKLQLSAADEQDAVNRNKKLHWFNDQDGRIQAALQGGWDFVSPEEVPSLGFGELHQENTDVNSKVSKVVSRGTQHVIRAYLMSIDKALYDEDQAAKEAQNALTDEALRPVQQGGQTIEGGYTPST